MAAVKGASTLQASVSNAAAATTTSSTLNLSTSYGATILTKVTNGTTAPTLPCAATINVSSDGAAWRQYAQQTAGLSASTAYPMSFDLPISVMFAQVVFSGNTAQAVTVEALCEYVTGI
jgi:hypothetical protein